MTFKQTDGTFCSQSESFADHRWMNILLDEVFTSLEEFSRKDDR